MASLTQWQLSLSGGHRGPWTVSFSAVRMECVESVGERIASSKFERLPVIRASELGSSCFSLKLSENPVEIFSDAIKNIYLPLFFLCFIFKEATQAPP